MQQAAAGQQKMTVPYLPYKTFTGFIESLRQGVPPRIDRSVMHTLAGSIQTNLLSTLRFLNLVQEQGASNERLYQFVKAEGTDRQRLLREMLTEAYTFVWADNFDLSSATGAEFDERFRRVATGDTARKAEAFFLAAAKDAEMPISRFITARGSRSAHPRTRRPGAQNGSSGKASQAQRENQTDHLKPPNPFTAANTKSVTFARGGTLTLSFSADLFTLDRSERDFVLDLIDRLNEFEQSVEGDDSAVFEDDEDGEIQF